MTKKTLNFLIPLSFIAFVLWTIPIGEIFEFDSDEGINIMKSLLYSEGFLLYKDIWSDQPPLFTFMLAWWLKIWGESIFAVRFLVLLFSTLLVWCFYQILRLRLGIIPAIAGVLILVNSHYYVSLSVSAMIGIPCIALAMVAIYFLTLGQDQDHSLDSKNSRNHDQIHLLLSGFFLALSLQTKLFTIFLVPLFACQILQCNFPQKRSQITNLIKWLLTLGATYLCTGIIFGSLQFEQLLQSHIKSRRVEELFDGNYYTFGRLLDHMFGQDYLFYILALLGTIIIFTTKKRAGTLPFAWLVSVCLLFANHKPVWYHYYPLIAIPLAWLAAYAIAAMVEFCQQWHLGNLHHSSIQQQQKLPFYLIGKTILLLLIVLLSLSATGLEMYRFRNDRADIRRDIMSTDNQERRKIVNLIRQHQYQTQWMFADKAIYAFYGGLKVPPETAVLSLKRVLSGELTYGQMVDIIEAYQPEQIVLSKFKDKIEEHPQGKQYLTTHYIKVYENEAIGVDYYLLKELVK